MSTGYREHISQRTSAMIDIMRGSSRVKTVLVTPRSVHSRRLMGDDYIQLEFTLETAVEFRIGDYIVDEVFGKYLITDEQMPRYNKTTGGYDYSLRFDAEYIQWKNYIHCLVADLDGTKQRMESDWSLTDKLEVHAQQIADEVNLIIGASAGEGYCVDVTRCEGQ